MRAVGLPDKGREVDLTMDNHHFNSHNPAVASSSNINRSRSNHSLNPQSLNSSVNSKSSRNKKLPKRPLKRGTTNASLGDSLHSVNGDNDTVQSVAGHSIASDSLSSIGFRSASRAPRGRIIMSCGSVGRRRSSVMPISSQHSVSSIGDSTIATSASFRSGAERRGRKMLVKRESHASLGDSLHGPNEDDSINDNYFTVKSSSCSFGDKVISKGSQKKNRVLPYNHLHSKHASHRYPSHKVPSTRNSKVKFGSVSVREFSIEVGDNPSCSRGPAISLSWEIVKTENYNHVDRFEQVRHPFRYLNAIDMVLSRKDREKMLLQNGYSESDIADAVRRIVKVKNQRRQTVHNLPVARLEEIVEGAGRKVKHFFSGSKTQKSLESFKCSSAQNKSGIGGNLKNSLPSASTITMGVEHDTNLVRMVLPKVRQSGSSMSGLRAPLAIVADEPDGLDDIFTDKTASNDVSLITYYDSTISGSGQTPSVRRSKSHMKS